MLSIEISKQLPLQGIDELLHFKYTIYSGHEKFANWIVEILGVDASELALFFLSLDTV